MRGDAKIYFTRECNAREKLFTSESSLWFAFCFVHDTAR